MLRFVLLFLLLAFAMAAPAQDIPPRRTLADTWTAMLKDHTREGAIDGVPLVAVDYAAIKSDPRWSLLLSKLATDPEPAERDARLAYWINAYNILAIEVVLKEYPVESIRDIGSLFKPVWKRPAGTVGGREVTLDEIEHSILRPMGEPRIHAAINCASVSCPDLRREAYTASHLGAQLDEQMHAWLANEQKGARLEPDGDLRVSWIFTHFQEDFGGTDDALVRFLTPYLPSDLASNVTPKTDIKAMDYDWSLNDTKRLS
ncbi:MAG: DUF547 domain-containing protein [Sumerlaeia bacterium]